MFRARRAVTTIFTAVTVVLIGLAAAPPVAADPSTPVRYPRGGATTTYSGLAFDTCTAPPLSTMRAWRKSPYRAVGVYIGGVNRGCDQPELTASWVSTTTRIGWRLLPVYMGRQAPCSTRTDSVKIRRARATTHGQEAARDAVERASALGMRPGSAVYVDMEHYDATARGCRAVVLEYLSAWTRQMHRLGYLAGVYAHQDSGALHLAQTYASTSYARPDAVWIARWDGSDELSDWPTVPNTYWPRRQRAKQYRGDHLESWGGVTLNIDNDRLSAPVATVARRYRIIRPKPVRARSGPARSFRVVRTFDPGAAVSVVCQTRGRRAGGSRVWDKLSRGGYVPDAFVGTPARRGFSRSLPKCGYAYQVKATNRVTVHSGPRASRPVTATLPAGALARVLCQRTGSTVGRNSVWNRLGDRRWVSDRYLATWSRGRFTSPVPHC